MLYSLDDKQKTLSEEIFDQNTLEELRTKEMKCQGDLKIEQNAKARCLAKSEELQERNDVFVSVLLDFHAITFSIIVLMN